MTTNVGEVANLTVRWDQKGVTIVKVERALLAKPAAMMRYRGRFEARALGAANKTLDFVRFDFPLLAAAESGDEMTDEARTLGEKLRANVTATTVVRVPLPRGATAIAVWDTAAHKGVSVSLTPSPSAAPAAATPAAPTPPAPARSAGAGSTRK